MHRTLLRFPAHLVVVALVLAVLPAASAEVPVEHVAGDLEGPVDLVFGPDGRLYYAELNTGKVRYVTEAGVPSDVVASVPASPGGNGGFTGLAIHPDEPGVFYTYYSMDKPGATNGKINRVTRIENGVETVLVDNIPWAELHEGGRLAFGTDGYLYVTVGDNDLQAPSQDDSSILGKILRITRDGSPAPGNPEGLVAGAYAKGFRNPFGITVHPGGRIFISDNGGEEEVNELFPGANYGYPLCTGPCNRNDVTDPLASWGAEHFGPTGVAVFGDTLYLGDYVFGRVRTVNINTGEKGLLWENSGHRVLDVETGPDDCLYVSGWGNIWRIPLADGACGFEHGATPIGGGGSGTGGGNGTDPGSGGTGNGTGDGGGSTPGDGTGGGSGNDTGSGGLDASLPGGDDEEESTRGSDTPGIGALPLLAALVGVAAVMRRYRTRRE